MRVERILEQYETVSDYREKEKVHIRILEDYSVADITLSDFAVLLETNWKVKYVPKKVGNSEIRIREENSKILRNKIALLAAGKLCTNIYEMKEYKHLALLLDHTGTLEADKNNQMDIKVFMKGEVEEKTKLFWKKMEPLLELKESVLEGKTDEELVENWDTWQPLFEQIRVLDKIVEEALQIGIEIRPEIVSRINKLQKKAGLSMEMLSSRAGVVSSIYYPIIHEEDVQGIDEKMLINIREKAPMTFRDYLTDNMSIMDNMQKHIENQLSEKLKQAGFINPKEAVLGNIRGKAYEYSMAIEVLKTKRPVYVIGEDRKLICVVEVAGQDGFLKPIVNQKQPMIMSDYLEKTKTLIQNMIKEKQPLSEDGVKTARMFMANMVCYEKLITEKKLGQGSLYQAIGEDKEKFMKAANMIYKDSVFEELTKNISLEQLEEFVNNHGEVELNRCYVQKLMTRKSAREGFVNVTL
jgi:hypothetical protein